MSAIRGFKIGNSIYKYEDTNIAEEFNNEKIYKNGDYVINFDDGQLYRYVGSEPSSGNWDSSKWESSVLSQEIDEFIIVSDTQPEATSNKIWVKETQPDEIEVPSYEDFLALERRVTALEQALQQN